MGSFNREKKRILFVEDDEDSWELVTFQLPDYKVISTRELTDGLRLAKLGYFDLYLLDNWLPDGTGVELCRRIRGFDPHTPIVFYSGLASSRDAQQALSAGAQAYLIKPVDPEELKSAIAQMVSSTREAAFRARQAEYDAICEELVIRQFENARRVENANGKYRRAEERALRVKAELAYLSERGTRGEFARQWAKLFSESLHPRSRVETQNVSAIS